MAQTSVENIILLVWICESREQNELLWLKNKELYELDSRSVDIENYQAKRLSVQDLLLCSIWMDGRIVSPSMRQKKKYNRENLARKLLTDSFTAKKNRLVFYRQGSN